MTVKNQYKQQGCIRPFKETCEACPMNWYPDLYDGGCKLTAGDKPTIYEYITEAYKDRSGGRGILAKELVKLSATYKEIKDMDNLASFLSIAETYSSHLSPAALRSVTEELYCEARMVCNASGK